MAPACVSWRRFRRAFEIAKNISTAWAAGKEAFDFVIQLGDIIEGNATCESSEADMRAVLAALDPLPRVFPFYSVMGNHCLRLSRARLQSMLPQLPATASSPVSAATAGRLYYSWSAGEAPRLRTDHRAHPLQQAVGRSAVLAEVSRAAGVRRRRAAGSGLLARAAMQAPITSSLPRSTFASSAVGLARGAEASWSQSFESAATRLLKEGAKESKRTSGSSSARAG